VTVNIGLGEASQNVKLLDTAAQELGQITGQKAIITRAKKSIANFKIRKGMPIGCAVTLRGDRMYEFIDRLCNVVLPRVHAGAEGSAGVSRDRLHARRQDQGHEHYLDDFRAQRRRRPRAAEGARLSSTHPGGGAINGTLSKNRQEPQEAQVQGAHSQSLPCLRSRARVYSQVSDVPNLFSRHGAQGRNPRRRESQLVGAIAKLCKRIP
jgi:hypothetical protein